MELERQQEERVQEGQIADANERIDLTAAVALESTESVADSAVAFATGNSSDQEQPEDPAPKAGDRSEGSVAAFAAGGSGSSGHQWEAKGMKNEEVKKEPSGNGPPDDPSDQPPGAPPALGNTVVDDSAPTEVKLG